MYLEQPKITSKPKNISIKEDEKAILDCNAKTRPTPNISWYKDDKSLKVDKKRIIKYLNGTLVINKVIPEDSGMVGLVSCIYRSGLTYCVIRYASYCVSDIC